MTTKTSLPTGTWVLDPTTTTVTVTATKLGLFSIPATLDVRSGTIEIDDENRVASVDISADAGSYTSKNAKRNEHVTGADFLDAENHPTITFRTGALEPTADGYQAEGMVTLRGATAPMAVTVSDVIVDGGTGTFSATATVDRTAIGISKLPSLVIGRDLEISVSAMATHRG